MKRSLQSILGPLKDTWKGWLAVIVILGAIYAVYDPVQKRIADWLLAQIIAGVGAAPPSFRMLPSHLIAAGLLLGFFLVVGIGYMVLARYRDSVGRSQRDTLMNAFHQSTKAADLICEQLFPGTAVPVKKVLSFKEVFTFYENGDCHCQQEMVLTADSSDVHFYEMAIAGEPEADPASFPEDIQLAGSASGSPAIAIS